MIKRENGQQAVLKDSSAFVPSPLEAITLDEPLPYPLYLKISEQFILFRNAGDLLSKTRAAALQEKGVDTLLIPKNAWLSYMDTYDNTVVDRSESDPEVSITRLRHALLAYQQYMEKKRKLKREHMEKFKLLGYKLADGIRLKPMLGAKLLRRYQDPTLYFVNHSVNVAVYSAAVANKLNLFPEDSKMLTFSALLHNVGNLFVPQEILYKPGSLSREEWEIVHTHPPRGAALLDALKAPREVVITAEQHHERMDGGGYPAKLRGTDIHLFAKICTIADVFDALTNRGPYQEALIPESAVEKMRYMLGKFDPQILNMISATT